MTKVKHYFSGFNVCKPAKNQERQLHLSNSEQEYYVISLYSLSWLLSVLDVLNREQHLRFNLNIVVVNFNILLPLTWSTVLLIAKSTQNYCGWTLLFITCRYRCWPLDSPRTVKIVHFTFLHVPPRTGSMVLLTARYTLNYGDCTL